MLLANTRIRPIAEIRPLYGGYKTTDSHAALVWIGDLHIFKKSIFIASYILRFPRNVFIHLWRHLHDVFSSTW